MVIAKELKALHTRRTEIGLYQAAVTLQYEFGMSPQEIVFISSSVMPAQSTVWRIHQKAMLLLQGMVTEPCGFGILRQEIATVLYLSVAISLIWHFRQKETH